MAKQVGPVNIKVGVNAAGAYTELGKLESRMKRTTNVARQQSRSVSTGIFDSFKQIGTSLVRGLISIMPGGNLLAGLSGAETVGAKAEASDGQLMAMGATISGTTNKAYALNAVLLTMAAGIMLSVKAAAAHIDEQAKLADRLAISTESLEGLTHAAGLSGISNQQLATGLSKLQQNLGKAALGEVEQVEALERLGLTYEEIATLPLDRQFGLIADRLNAISDTSVRAAISTELFGKAGQQLAPLLAEGSEGMAELTKEADRLGLTFTREQAARVEGMNDAWSRTTASFQGFTNQLTIALAPTLHGTADAITELVTGLSQLTRALGETAASLPGGDNSIKTAVTGATMFGLLSVLSSIGDTLSGPGAGSGDVAREAMVGAINRAMPAAVSRGNQPVVNAINHLGKELSDSFRSIWESQVRELGDLTGTSRLDQEIARLTIVLQRKEGALNWLGPLAGDQLRLLRENFRIEVEQLRIMDTHIQRLRILNDLQQKASQITAQTQSPLSHFIDRLQELSKLQTQGLLGGNTANLATAGAFRQLADSLPQASATGPEALQQGSIAAQAAINRFNRQGGAVSLQEQIRNVLRQTQQIEQQQLNEAREVRRILQGLGVVAPAGLGP